MTFKEFPEWALRTAYVDLGGVVGAAGELDRDTLVARLDTMCSDREARVEMLHAHDCSEIDRGKARLRRGGTEVIGSYPLSCDEKGCAVYVEGVICI